MKIIVKFFIYTVCFLLLAGCGQKGDLYLPGSEADKNDAVTIEPKTTKKTSSKKVQP